MTSAITQSDVKTTLTSRRDGRVVENTDYAAFSRRIIRAYGRRVADGDVEALTDLLTLATHLNGVIGEAVAGLRRAGYAWSEIAARAGMTRQAAQQRWGGETA